MNESARVREVELVAIGDSRGIRLPDTLLDKYGWSDWLLLEEVEDGVVLRGKEAHKLSWKETYRAMAAEAEDWSDMDSALSDGIE